MGEKISSVIKEKSNKLEKVNQASINSSDENGSQAMFGRDKLPKTISNKQLIAEEHDLIKSEKKNRKSYEGWRVWLRLLRIYRVIGMLSLHLYLDQYEIHHKQHLRVKNFRMETARGLTWIAIFGEKLYGIRFWCVHAFLLSLRWFFVGSDANKERNQEKQAVWLKENIIGLGPTFIKLGQSMGTRADLLPLPFVKELGTLVDDVPPFPNEVAFALIEKELKRKISEVYDEFEIKPIAAASLGQVYRAKLKTGEEVAVKIQRPNLESIIKGDIEILRRVAKFAERFPRLNENADWAGMLKEFDNTIHEEMDYALEGRNAECFKENFKSWTNIHVQRFTGTQRLQKSSQWTLFMEQR